MSTQSKSYAYVHIHQDFQWFDSGVILAQVVLCPHRDKSDFYVHMHQDFQRFDNGVIIVYEVYVHIETSLMFMSTYIRFDNGAILLLEVLCPHRAMSIAYIECFYIHIEISLMLMCTYIRIFNGLTMVASLYRSFMSTQSHVKSLCPHKSGFSGLLKT